MNLQKIYVGIPGWDDFQPVFIIMYELIRLIMDFTYIKLHLDFVLIIAVDPVYVKMIQTFWI